VVVGNGGTILRTTNGGTNWLSSSDGSTFPLTTVATLDSGVAIIADRGRIRDADGGYIFRSTDTAKSWINVGLHTCGYASSSFMNSSNGIMVGGGWGLGMGGMVMYSDVRRTFNRGISWGWYSVKIDTQYLNKVMVGVSFIDSTFCVAITDDGFILRYLSGSNWAIIDSLPARLRAISFIDTTLGYIVGDSGKIWRTSNSGNTWMEQTSGTSQHLNSAHFLSTDNGYVVGNNGTILHTIDGGTQWLTIPSGTTQNLKKIFFTDPQHGWTVGENGTILKSGIFTTFHSSRSGIDFGEVVDTTMKSEDVIISNPGTDTLVVSNISSDNAEFSFTPSALTVLPAMSETLSILFSPIGGGIKSSHIIIQHNAYSSPDTINVSGTGLDYDTTFVDLQTGWNLVTVPRSVINDSVHVLFPPGISDAFWYDTLMGYQTSITLQNNIGYWLKIGSTCSIPIPGIAITGDTIDVHRGWNLIGSLSIPYMTSDIEEQPERNVESNYYGYNLSYESVTILEPGKAYWVKAKEDGKLIFSPK